MWSDPLPSKCIPIWFSTQRKQFIRSQTEKRKCIKKNVVLFYFSPNLACFLHHLALCSVNTKHTAVSLHSDSPTSLNIRRFPQPEEKLWTTSHIQRRRRKSRRRGGGAGGAGGGVGVSTWLSGCQHPLLALAASLGHLPSCRPPLKSSTQPSPANSTTTIY